MIRTITVHVPLFFFLQTKRWLGDSLYNELLAYCNTLRKFKDGNFTAGEIINLSYTALKMMLSQITGPLRLKLEADGCMYYHLLQLAISQGNAPLVRKLARFEFDNHIGMLHPFSSSRD